MSTIHTCPECGKRLKFDRQLSGKMPITCPSCHYKGKVSDFPLLEMIAASCPSCQATLQILKEAKGNITCPVCKKTADAATFQYGQKKDVEAGSGTANNEEIIALYKVGKLLDTNGREYLLMRGANTIGRQHPSANASILIDSDDSFMSRHHAGIDVVMNNDSTFSHILFDHESLNGTFHNGTRLEPSDRLYLKSGDNVRLGHTVLKFIVE